MFTTLEGIAMVERLLPENAYSPILVTLEGIMLFWQPATNWLE